MIAPELFGLSPPGNHIQETKTKSPDNNGDFAAMLDAKENKISESSQMLHDKKDDAYEDSMQAKSMLASANAKENSNSNMLKQSQKEQAEPVKAGDVPKSALLAMQKQNSMPVQDRVQDAELLQNQMQNYLQMQNQIQNQNVGPMLLQPQMLSAQLAQQSVMPAYLEPTPMTLTPSMLLEPTRSMPMFMQNPQIIAMQQQMLQQPMLQQAMMASQMTPEMLSQMSSQMQTVPTEMSFNPHVNNFVCDGLVEMLQGAEKAGVTDGKEVVNLINKMVSEFNLDKDKLTSEFEKVALLNPKQKAEFTIGQFLKDVGIEDKQLDKAYAIVNEVVARESIKQSICEVKNNSNKLDELMLTSAYSDKKSPALMKLNQMGKNPYQLNNKSVMPASLMGNSAKFEDMMLQKDGSNDPMMFNVGMQNNQFKMQDFGNLKPVTHLSADQISNPSVLKDSLVTDAKILVRDGGGKMEITLHPDHMGKIEIKVDTQSNRVNVEVMCTNAQVKHMVESQVSDLKLAMAGSNLITDKINVTLASNSSSGGNFNESTEHHASKQGFNEHARDNWERHNSKKQNDREFQFA